MLLSWHLWHPRRYPACPRHPPGPPKDCACARTWGCARWMAERSCSAGRRTGCCGSVRPGSAMSPAGGTASPWPGHPGRRPWRRPAAVDRDRPSGPGGRPGTRTCSGPGPGDVTVVIPVRDRTAELARCLSGLGEYQVIVVDDGSPDPGAVAAVAAAAGARCVRRAVNGGPAAARNTGLAAVQTPLAAFLDSDCVPVPGWLGPLLPHFRDPVVAAVAPRIVPYALPAQPGRPEGDGPGRDGPAGWLAQYEGVSSTLDMGPVPSIVRPGSKVPYVPGAALVLRVEAAGDGFAEHMPVGEDVNFVWRLAAAGWHVRYERRPRSPTSTGSGWAAGSRAGWTTGPRPRRWNCSTRARSRRSRCPGGAPPRGPPPRSATPPPAPGSPRPRRRCWPGAWPRSPASPGRWPPGWRRAARQPRAGCWAARSRGRGGRWRSPPRSRSRGCGCRWPPWSSPRPCSAGGNGARRWIRSATSPPGCSMT